MKIIQLEKKFVKAEEIKDGKYNVEYAYLEAPYDSQLISFRSANLGNATPAKVRYMQAHFQENSDVLKYSRTEMDAVNMPDTRKIALVEPGFILPSYGGVEGLVDAHRKGNEFVIARKKDEDRIKNIYKIVEYLEKNGKAVVIDAADTNNDYFSIELATDEFDTNQISSLIHGDNMLRIDPRVIGGWLRENKDIKSVNLYLDSAKYMKSQGGVYVNKVRAGGPGSDFSIDGDNLRNLDYDGGAFGAQFIPAEGGSQKPYTLEEKNKAIKDLTDVKNGSEGYSKLESAIVVLNKLE